MIPLYCGWAMHCTQSVTAFIISILLIIVLGLVIVGRLLHLSCVRFFQAKRRRNVCPHTHRNQISLDVRVYENLALEVHIDCCVSIS
jgi:hypothetical protein